jgi:hypothetical protein
MPCSFPVTQAAAAITSQSQIDRSNWHAEGRAAGGGSAYANAPLQRWGYIAHRITSTLQQQHTRRCTLSSQPASMLLRDGALLPHPPFHRTRRPAASLPGSLSRARMSCSAAAVRWKKGRGDGGSPRAPKTTQQPPELSENDSTLQFYATAYGMDPKNPPSIIRQIAQEGADERAGLMGEAPLYASRVGTAGVLQVCAQLDAFCCVCCCVRELGQQMLNIDLPATPTPIDRPPPPHVPAAESATSRAAANPPPSTPPPLTHTHTHTHPTKHLPGPPHRRARPPARPRDQGGRRSLRPGRRRDLDLV